jgi:hypothetical protein
MQRIEYAVDVWDLTGIDPRPDAAALLEHLNDFGSEGWELVSAWFNVDVARVGESHLLVFKRVS